MKDAVRDVGKSLTSRPRTTDVQGPLQAKKPRPVQDIATVNLPEERYVETRAFSFFYFFIFLLPASFNNNNCMW